MTHVPAKTTSQSLPAFAAPRAFGRIVPLLVWLLIWQAVVKSGLVRQEFLPSVDMVAVALWGLFTTNELWVNLFASIYRAAVGLVMGCSIGVVAGLIMATSPIGSRILWPFVTATYSLPKTSLVPLFILWFGIGDVTSILTVALSCLLPVVLNTFHGVKAIPQVTIWSAQAMGTPKHRMLWSIMLPASSMSILTGVRIALGFSFVLTISAEMIASKIGIGKMIYLYGENGSYPYMFAAISMVVVVAFVADRALVRIIRQVTRWHDSAYSHGEFV